MQTSILMIKNTNNPLEIEDKLHTVEEFTLALRTKFGSNDNLPDSVLVDIFMKKYPMYSCKIKKSQNQAAQKSCGCC
jgi:hypothetical protein